MKLIAVTYHEYQSGWTLNELKLSDLNLLVGKNATGKTRTVLALWKVGACLTGASGADCRFRLCFSNDGEQVIYEFDRISNLIQHESLSKNGTMLLNRTSSHCLFYGEEINPPAHMPVVSSRRDTKKYPESEQLLLWVEHLSYFVFSNVTSSKRTNTPFMMNHGITLNKMFEQTPNIRLQLLSLFSQLHYPISDIFQQTTESGDTLLLVKEEGIPYPLHYLDLSNGLFRVLSVLIYMLFSASLLNSRCLLIDDLGEGLDYERSNILGNIIFSFCKEHQIQLIVTTNDSFLMDTIGLEYWTVLTRNLTEVNSISQTTHPEIFRQFKLTGLNNFDLFASDYIENHKA